MAAFQINLNLKIQKVRFEFVCTFFLGRKKKTIPAHYFTHTYLSWQTIRYTFDSKSKDESWWTSLSLNDCKLNNCIIIIIIKIVKKLNIYYGWPALMVIMGFMLKKWFNRFWKRHNGHKGVLMVVFFIIYDDNQSGIRS